MDARSFFVVVPFFNESAGMVPTLEALAGQSDQEFTLVLVDNASTDDSRGVAERWLAAHPSLRAVLIGESEKGTGAASDSGFRFAIAHGARWIARTDADCLPRRDWVANLKRAFRNEGLEMIAGKIKPRGDDIALTWRDRLVLPLVVFVAENFGKLHRRGRQFRYTYFMMAGNNMAITADLYERAGGFPRTSIERAHEDRALSESVRTLTSHAKVKSDVVVFNSIRRARAYGYVNTLLWYWDHRYRPEVVDVRLPQGHPPAPDGAARSRRWGTDLAAAFGHTLPVPPVRRRNGDTGTPPADTLQASPRTSPSTREERDALSGAEGPTPSPRAGRAEVGADPSPHAGRVGVGMTPSLHATARVLFHELRLYLASHPLPLLFGEAVRLLGPVVNVPLFGHVVNDPAVGRALLVDSRFTKSGPGSAGPVITQVMGPYALLNMDGPAHHELRTKLHDLFAPGYLDTMLAAVLPEPLAELRRRLDAGVPVDLVRFMATLTGRLTCHMLGMDPAAMSEAEVLRIHALSTRVIGVMRLTTRRLSPRRAAIARENFEQLVAHAAPAFSREDLPDAAIIARLRALGLSFDEAKGVLAVLFLVGMQTVTTAVPRIVALLLDSGQMPLLRSNPTLVGSAIDEGLRYTVPSPIMLRSATEPLTVAGHRFSARRRIALFTYNMLKDPRYIPHPRRFDISREHDPVVKNLWFGAGAHFCLGYALAQREIRAVLEALLSVDGDLCISARRPARGVMLPGYAQLIVTRTGRSR